MWLLLLLLLILLSWVRHSCLLLHFNLQHTNCSTTTTQPVFFFCSYNFTIIVFITICQALVNWFPLRCTWIPFCASRGRRRSVYSSPSEEPTEYKRPCVVKGKSLSSPANEMSTKNKQQKKNKTHKTLIIVTAIQRLHCWHFVPKKTNLSVNQWTVVDCNSTIEQALPHSVVPLSRDPCLLAKLKGKNISWLLLALAYCSKLVVSGGSKLLLIIITKKKDSHHTPYLHAAAALCARPPAGSASAHLETSTASLKWT